MPEIYFQYPIWLCLIVLVAAIAYAAVLYFRSSDYKGKNKNVKRALSALRFLSVGLIGWLLLGPMIKSYISHTKKPTIVILSDQSQSVGAWMQKNTNTLEQDLSSLSQSLSEKYDTEVYTFGDEVTELGDSASYDAPITNITKAIEHISDIHEGDNVGATILITDGIYNEGKSPIYAKYAHTAPIYAVALGDTTRRGDLSIRQVLHNDIGYLNDQMNIQVDLQAYGSTGQSTRLLVRRKEGDRFVNVFDKNIRINGDDFFTTEDITLDLNKSGINQYRISASPVANEENRQNNYRDIYIEVLDARQTIMIVANAPHPDLAALKTLLKRNKNYEVEISYDKPTGQQMKEVDLMIFHNLPSKKTDIQDVVSQLDRNKKPRLYITGTQLDKAKFNRLQKGIQISTGDNVVNQVFATESDDFLSFSVSDQLSERLPKYPPLSAPFGEYRVAPDVDVWIYQRIGNVATNYPLLALRDESGIKSAYLVADGIWQWKYFDYVQSGNFDLVGELIDKTTLYATTVEDKRKFRVSSAQNVYNQNEMVAFSAELYNNNYELVNQSEVALSIINSSNETFDYTFSPTDNTAYALSVGQLAPDTYRYRASTEYNGERYEAAGRFSVKEIQYELYNTEANHNILQSLANKTGGRVYAPTSISELESALLDNSSIKPVIYSNEKTKSLLDYKWLFGLLALLLGAEWFVRRYFGAL